MYSNAKKDRENDCWNADILLSRNTAENVDIVPKKHPATMSPA